MKCVECHKEFSCTNKGTEQSPICDLCYQKMELLYDDKDKYHKSNLLVSNVIFRRMSIGFVIVLVVYSPYLFQGLFKNNQPQQKPSYYEVFENLPSYSSNPALFEKNFLICFKKYPNKFKYKPFNRYTVEDYQIVIEVCKCMQLQFYSVKMDKEGNEFNELFTFLNSVITQKEKCSF
jgi:hypothetical protein